MVIHPNVSSLLDNPFPQGFTNPPGAANGLLTGVGGQIEGVLQNTPTPYVEQYTLDVQQQFRGNTTFDIAYVGDRGRKQQQSREGGIDFDQVPASEILAEGANLETAVQIPTTVRSQQGAPSTESRQLLHNCSSAIRNTPACCRSFSRAAIISTMRCKCVSASASRRDCSLRVPMSGAKNFDNGTNHQDSFDPLKNYAVTSYDVRQRFIASYIYDLPFGRGRRFGSHVNSAENAILGGWQINGITTLTGR